MTEKRQRKIVRITGKFSAIIWAGIFSVPFFATQKNDEELMLIDWGLGKKDTKAIVKKARKNGASLED